VAIVQISRIQHRRGTSENLPQLAVGEIGLAVDTRKVYIGNGGTDAPQIENIELLTNQSDLLDSADTYTYKGTAAGYTVQTGTSGSQPVTRTIQAKLDEVASVKDFGAKGDGTTDDSAAINRALYELFARETNTSIRRALFFPAGTYICNDTLKVPPFAKLFGDGHNSSIIKANTLGAPNTLMQTADSKRQIDGSVGNSGATAPGNNHFEGLTFYMNADSNDVVTINQAQHVTFTNCRIVGRLTGTPTSIGNSAKAVKLESTAAFKTQHVHFVGCEIADTELLVVGDNDMNNITFSGCSFTRAFKAIKLGEAVTGSAPSVNGPQGVKVTNSVFDNIYHNAVHIFNGPGFTSAFNTYLDCANNGNGVGNPTQHVIDFDKDDAHSVADTFERTDADDASTTRRINSDSAHVKSFAIDPEGVKFGGYIRDYGQQVTLDDNSTKDSGISFADNTTFAAIEIDYYITRGSTKRQGTMRITHDATQQVLDDDFSENNGSAGVTFSLTNSSNVTKLRYTTTSTGSAATFNYSIRIIR